MYRLGYGVANHPWRTMAASVIFFLACSGGLFLWVNVTEEDILWTPYGSKFERERGWIQGPNSIGLNSGFIHCKLLYFLNEIKS